MSGVSLDVHCPIFLIPPRMTRAVSAAMIAPMSQSLSAKKLVVAAGGLNDDRGRLVRLEQVAGADDAEHGGESIEPGEELPELGPTDLGQAGPQVVHGTAGDGAVLVDLPVLHAEGRLGHLHGHGEEAEDDDPQGGTGAADGDRHGHAGDVAQPNGARELGGERLEARDLARVGLAGEATADDADGVAESGDRLEAEVDGEEDGRGHEPDDDERDAERADLELEEDDAAEGLCRGPEEGFDGLVDAGGGRCRPRWRLGRDVRVVKSYLRARSCVSSGGLVRDRLP
jgi:hypothetical protein